MIWSAKLAPSQPKLLFSSHRCGAGKELLIATINKSAVSHGICANSPAIGQELHVLFNSIEYGTRVADFQALDPEQSLCTLAVLCHRSEVG